MGLSVDVQVLNHAMEDVLGDMKRERVSIYCDDFVLWGSTADEHKCLLNIFLRLRERERTRDK